MRLLTPPPSSRSGFTLVELAVSLVVLLVAVGGTLSSISATVVLGESARETTLAYLAAERQVEAMRSGDFSQLFARFNKESADDPDGPATAPGADFAVEHLTPWKSDADGMAGRILFPVDDGVPGELREDLTFIGRQHDLDASGTIDGAATEYALLPVRVRVEWKGRAGNSYVELQTVLVAP